MGRGLRPSFMRIAMTIRLPARTNTAFATRIRALMAACYLHDPRRRALHSAPQSPSTPVAGAPATGGAPTDGDSSAPPVPVPTTGVITGPVFRSSVDLVALNVIVTDPRQRFVAGLSAGDFAVFEDHDR